MLIDNIIGWLFLVLLCAPIVKLYIFVDEIEQNQFERKHHA